MGGRSSASRGLKRILTALLAVVLLAGIVSYFVFRIQTPVSLDRAIERFREGNDTITSGRHQVDRQSRRNRATSKPNRQQSSAATFRAGPRSSFTTRRGDTSSSTRHMSSPLFDVVPAEGVYSYVGSGKEGIWPFERDFPNRYTQRIITHEDRDTWVEHHIFSEERASWTLITTSETGRLVHQQRNYIRIGRYEEDKTFPFYPPILAVRFPPRVGDSWHGVSKGETNDGESYTGAWTVKIVRDGFWNIGGTRARVVAYEFDVVLEGEFNGTVSVDVWFAPRYGLTVREEYDADAYVGPLKYNGKWFVELRSLKPRT